MHPMKHSHPARLLLCGAVLLAIAGAYALPLAPRPGATGVAYAQTPSNPANPVPAAASSPSAPHPDTAAANPSAAATIPPAALPSPDAAKANPGSAAKPEAAPATPTAMAPNPPAAKPEAAPAMPATSAPNPAAAKSEAAPAMPAASAPAPAAARGAADGSSGEPGPGGGRAGNRISWSTDYRSYDKVTGYVNSIAHGNRLVVTYVSPAEAASIYRHNANLVRENKTTGFKPYPIGTVIAVESWLKNANGSPSTQGPCFLMRKERGGFDTEAKDWTYGFTDADLRLIAEGKAGKVTFCRACHISVTDRDAVFAVDR